MQYEKNGIFAFMGRRDELCIRNLNTQLHDRMITAMKKCYYSQAPLPFVGQKRMFASEFRKAFQRQDGVRRPVRRFRTALAHHQAGKTRRNRNLQ